MASKKLTQLPTATEVTTSDKIYIVDVSDTTESPQGTSKQATVANVLPNGTWTPEFTTFIGAITAATLNSATYLRVGNIVSCSISLSIEVDFSSDNTGSFEFTLPFSTTTGGACGSLSSSNITKQFNGAVRGSGTTLGRIVMASEDTSLAIPSASCHVLFQYEVN